MTLNRKTMLLTITLLSPVCMNGMDRITNLAKIGGTAVKNYFTLEGYEHSKATAYKAQLQKNVEKYQEFKDCVVMSRSNFEELVAPLEGSDSGAKAEDFQARMSNFNLGNLEAPVAADEVVVSRLSLETLKAQFDFCDGKIEDEDDAVAEVQKRFAGITPQFKALPTDTLRAHYESKAAAFNDADAGYKATSYKASVWSARLAVLSWIGLGASLYVPCDPKVRMGAAAAALSTTTLAAGLRYKAGVDVNKAIKTVEDLK